MKINSIARWALAALLIASGAHAADTSISGLSAGTTIVGTEPIPTVQSGTTVKTTPAAIATYMATSTRTWTATQTFVTPALGTPASGVLTNATGLPISTGVSGLGTGVATALGVNVGSAGAPVVLNGALGTPSSGTATNLTGLPAAGVVGTAAILGANTFTDAQTISQTLTNTAALSVNASTVSGAATNTFATVTGTWNTTGSPTAVLLNVTNTASNASAKLLDLQVGGTSFFRVLRSGGVRAGLNGSAAAPAYSLGSASTAGIYSRGGDEINFTAGSGPADFAEFNKSLGILLTTNAPTIGWTNSATAGSANDTGMSRNAAGVVEFNNGSQCSTASNCRDAKLRHLLAAGTAPTVAGSCGTSPSIVGGDTAMTVTAGTVAPTSCTVTFGTAYANAPVCTANAQTTTTALNVATTTTTVIVSASALTASEKIQIICIGY